MEDDYGDIILLLMPLFIMLVIGIIMVLANSPVLRELGMKGCLVAAIIVANLWVYKSIINSIYHSKVR